jgi:hypothetical protein
MTRTDDVLKPPSKKRARGLGKLLIPALTATLVATIATGMSAGQRGDRENDDEQEDGSTYTIGLWGDMPYSDTQALTGVPNLIADMNKGHLAFTMHDGDLKGGNGTPGSVTPTICSDALYVQAQGFFDLKAPRPPPGATTTGPTAIGRRTVASTRASDSITSGSCCLQRRSRSASTSCGSRCRPTRSASTRRARTCRASRTGVGRAAA